VVVGHVEEDEDKDWTGNGGTAAWTCAEAEVFVSASVVSVMFCFLAQAMPAGGEDRAQSRKYALVANVLTLLLRLMSNLSWHTLGFPAFPIHGPQEMALACVPRRWDMASFDGRAVGTVKFVKVADGQKKPGLAGGAAKRVEIELTLDPVDRDGELLAQKPT